MQRLSFLGMTMLEEVAKEVTRGIEDELIQKYLLEGENREDGTSPYKGREQGLKVKKMRMQKMAYDKKIRIFHLIFH